MRLLRLAIALLAVFGAGVWLTAPPARALPHGCASFTRDFRAHFDVRSHNAGVNAFVDQPCSFTYADGDTYSGSGRFTVICETGGYLHHEDFQDGEYPPVAYLPIPQPCAIGAKVTIEGYRAGTGGGVIAGGMCGQSASETAACARRTAMSGGRPLAYSDDWMALCQRNAAMASVDLTEPVNYSGLLTYTGSVRCDGADVVVKSVRATPYLGYNRASLGPARCNNCNRTLSLTGTVPAESWLWEVVLKFSVSRAGKTHDVVYMSRYVAAWAGVPVLVCGPDTCVV